MPLPLQAAPHPVAHPAPHPAAPPQRPRRGWPRPQALALQRGLGRAWACALLLLATVLSGTPASAQGPQNLTLGVLASRSAEVMAARYEPLAQYLGVTLGIPVQLRVLARDSLEQAMRQHRLDLVLTSPSHYLLLRARSALTSVLATAVTAYQGLEVPAMGGVVLVSSTRADLRGLADLRGRRVAVPGFPFLGGYQAPLLELREHGIGPQELQLLEVSTYDAVVQAVREGRADAGFIRTGELEHMADAGAVQWSEVRVLGQRVLSGFPYVVSTRLYPEWPVVALPHLEPAIARQIASALLALDPSHPALRAAGLHAFTVPADYSPVEELARTLRLPPYDSLPAFTWRDVLAQYRMSATAIGVLLAALSVLLWVLAVQRRRLKRALQRTQLGDSVFRHAQEGIFITTPEGRIIDTNDSFTRITGYSRDEVLGRSPNVLSSGRHDAAFYQRMWQAILSEGRWHGELWNRRKNGEVYAQVLTITSLRDAQGRVQNHVAVFSDITTQKEHQQQLERIAHYDALTGLPNRSLLQDRLQQALAQAQRRGTQVGVVFLDLDGFKAVNDTHGHDAGDHLLKELARRMLGVLREGDTLARLGGDEFVAVLGDLTQQADCERVLLRLLQAASAPVILGEAHLRVSASLGVALYPRDAGDADLLLRLADQAMYQAKHLGKNRYHFFDVQADAARATPTHTAAAELELALQRHELQLYFQPKVHLRLGHIVGAEALIRWLHPDGSVRGPGSFLPAVEGQAVAGRLDQWVLRQALAHLQRWAEGGRVLPLSLNISACHLQQPHFVPELRQLLAAHPAVPRGCLTLEVLETSALQDIDGVARTIRACAELGVRFALDDFGTGYSTLTYLKRLPAQELKIDQSFVRDMLTDPEDLTIVEGVISLAQAFGRSVVAEGVESTAHGTLLLRLGCEVGQGYGIARPMPEAELQQWLATWQPPPDWQALRQHHPSRAAQPLVAIEVQHRQWLAHVLSTLSQGQAGPGTAAPDPASATLIQSLPLPGPHAEGQRQALLAQLQAVHTAAQTATARATTASSASSADRQAAAEALQHASQAFLAALYALEPLTTEDTPRLPPLPTPPPAPARANETP